MTNSKEAQDECLDCVEKCKYGRDLNAKKSGTLLRCMLCSCWYHATCVGVPEEETAGAWTCPKCRELFFGIGVLQREVYGLRNISESILDAIKTHRMAVADETEGLRGELKKRDNEIEALKGLLESPRFIDLDKDNTKQDNCDAIETKNKLISTLQSEIAVLEARVAHRDVEIEAKSDEISAKNEEIEAKNEEIDAKKDEIESLRLTVNEGDQNIITRRYSLQPHVAAQTGGGYIQGSALTYSSATRDAPPVRRVSNPPAPLTRAQRPSAAVVGTGSQDQGLSVSGDNFRLAVRPSRRKVNGIFLTRVSPTTTAGAVENFVRRATGADVIVEKLKTKFEWYSSFHVKCPSEDTDKLLKADMWPEGMLVKPFFEKSTGN